MFEPEKEDYPPPEKAPRPALRSLGMRQRTGGLHAAQREIKMLAPHCVSDEERGFDGCQGRVDGDARWWEDCLARGHDPYFTEREQFKRTPVSEENEAGERVILRYEETRELVRSPNLVQIALNERINAGLGIAKARAKGYILPEEHPTDALRPFCQFRDCWSDKIVVRSAIYGDYCSEDQAKAVGLDYLGRPVEVLDRRKRAQQFAQVNL